MKNILLLLTAVAGTALGLMSSGCNKADTINESAYLFVYFIGNDSTQEAVRYAISEDGYHYYALNRNLPVIDPRTISSSGGVRDPHIMRGPDGKTFYMVLTDMSSSVSWNTNRAMVLLKSTDLINWEHSIIDLSKRYPGQENLTRVWTPQTIYDPEADKLMIYWAMQYGDGPDAIYYAYANEEFTDLEGEPQPLFIPDDNSSCSDGDIVYKDGLYHLFYRTKGHGNGIKVATSPSLTSGQWTQYPDYKQQTNDAVESAGIFKLIDSNKYILMYDVYIADSYQFAESSDLVNFRAIDSEVTMDFHPRSGAILPITKAELDRLYDRWGIPNALSDDTHNPIIAGFHADPDIIYSNQTEKYYIYTSTEGNRKRNNTTFRAYSSPDLKEWKDEGVVIDILSYDVDWADSQAWAPAVLERKKADGYHYYLYFSANNPETSRKEIGVAHATKPTGPFIGCKDPLITESPVNAGYQIDVAILNDPLSDDAYIYWGNRYMAGARLNPDMMSIDESTITVMTPQGGTDETFRYNGAPYVLYRNATYYFMWSVGNVKSKNYHVAYGTSTSPLGPIKVADEPIILAPDSANHIYGTGHNSVVQIPRTNDWVMAYHRFNQNFLGPKDRPEMHREVCLDSVTFDPEGRIKPIRPSR